MGREFNSQPFYNDDLHIWTSKNDKGQEIVNAVGDEGVPEGVKHKIFYNSSNLLIDNSEKAQAAIKWLFLKSQKKNKANLFKPIVIANVPYQLTQIEIKSLNDILEAGGARQVIIMNQDGLPDEKLLKPNHKIPGNIISGDDRYKSDEFALLFIVGIVIFFGWFFVSGGV